jgi:anthranilate synthase component I
VRPTEKFIIERYSHVMHIVSNVVGEIRPGEDALSALLAGLPAGTVSGAPKVRAMQIIDELEPEKRGVYGGGVGYFAANGEMDFCIALRTAVLKDGQLYIQAGGGVVYDSDPEAEFQETVNKSRALRAAAEDAGRFAGRQSVRSTAVSGASATVAARPSTAQASSASTVSGRVRPATTTSPSCAARKAARSR